MVKEDKFKNDMKEKVGIVSIDNYNPDSMIFTILKVRKKEDKENFIKFLHNNEEGVFLRTLERVSDYYLKQIEKEYIKIIDIPSLENVIGMINDRIKSNKSMIKFCKNKFIQHKKELNKCKDFDKINSLEMEIFRDKRAIENYEDEIRKYEDIICIMKYDIKDLANQSKTNSIKQQEQEE